jgi:hypothetical protein
MFKELQNSLRNFNSFRISSSLKWIGLGIVSLLGILTVVSLVAFPFIVIFAMNTLFPVLAIPYTLQTYIASGILTSPIYNLAMIRIKLANLDY